MVWDFKQHLFASQRRVSPKLVSDLSSPAVRLRLQEHIDSSGELPPEGAPDEYAALFEAVYPAESDRSAYMSARMRGAKPSYGHLAIATLMQAGKARVVWTTNFDALVADACARVYGGTSYLSSVDLDRAHMAAELLAEEQWPIELKLHGDFRSRRLKNTTDECREQDELLRSALINACHRSGLIAAGYSGRDDSVMDALEEALLPSGAFPAGLFWLNREGDPPLPRVTTLLDRAVAAGVEAFLVPIQNFDEGMRDLIRNTRDIDTSALDALAEGRRRWTPVPRIAGKQLWPVVRLNGLPIASMPSTCRKVVCHVGGYRELQSAIAKAEVDVLATRSRAGVLAFGSDASVKKALDPYGIAEFDLHTIETRRLRYESQERGLLRDAVVRALARAFEMDVTRRRSAALLVPASPRDARWDPLGTLVGDRSGAIKGNTELVWREGVAVRLEWANDRLWLVVDPRTVFDDLVDASKAAAADFARERTVRRYNRKLNELIDFWARLFGTSGELKALGVTDGVDATFELSQDTAFSWRASA